MMINFLSDFQSNTKPHAFNFPGGDVIANSFCVFSKQAIKMINGSMHIVPSYEDTEGWYLDNDMNIQTVKRSIVSGMVIFPSVNYCRYGIYNLEMSFTPFPGANPTIGLFSSDFKRSIVLLNHKGSNFMKIGTFYSGLRGFDSHGQVKEAAKLLPPIRSMNIMLDFSKKNVLYISYNKKVVYYATHMIDEPLIPMIAFNIAKPSIPHPTANPLIIHKFTFKDE